MPDDLELCFRRLRGSNILGVVTADEKNITGANGEFLRMTGRTRADLEAGRINWREMTPPEFLAEEAKSVRRLKQQGWFPPFEKEYFHKDGGRVPVRLEGFLLARKPFRCVCFVQDLTEHKQAAAALQENEARFRAITELSPDIITIFDRHGHIKFNSAAAGRVHGHGKRKLDGRSTFDLVHPEDRASVRHEFGRLLENKAEVVRVKYRYCGADGSYKWMEAVARNELADPHIQGIIAISRDIAEQKQAGDALKASEFKHRRLYETMRDAFVRVALTGEIRECNSAYREMLGYSDAELVRVKYQDLTPKKWHKFEAAIVKGQILARGFSEVYEKEYRRKDGTVFPVELRAFLIRDAAGRPEEIWGIARDVTERQQAQDELRRLNATLERRVADRTRALAASEEKFGRLFATVADAVLLFDGQTRQVVEANDAMLRLYGYTRAESRRLHAADLSAEPEATELSVRRTLGGQEPVGVRRLHRKKDGTVFPVQISASTFEFQGRRLVCGVVRDITREMEMEKEILSISEREQQRIARDLHDDLCQHLTGIQFLATSLAADLQALARPETAGAARIARLTQQALQKTRELSHGLAPVELERGGLDVALRRLSLQVQQMFRCQCHYHCDPAVPLPPPAIGIHLYRIVQEAVSNASRHGRASRIEIAIAARRRGWALKIADNGTGIGGRKTGGTGKPGMGLRVMQYRAGIIGGTLAVRPRSRQGTEVICTMAGSTLPAASRKKDR